MALWVEFGYSLGIYIFECRKSSWTRKSLLPAREMNVAKVILDFVISNTEIWRHKISLILKIGNEMHDWYQMIALDLLNIFSSVNFSPKCLLWPVQAPRVSLFAIILQNIGEKRDFGRLYRSKETFWWKVYLRKYVQ